MILITTVWFKAFQKLLSNDQKSMSAHVKWINHQLNEMYHRGYGPILRVLASVVLITVWKRCE